MTIAQLKQAIADLPDDMDVFIGEVEFGEGLAPANNAEVKIIGVTEEGIHSHRTVFILSED